MLTSLIQSGIAQECDEQDLARSLTYETIANEYQRAKRSVELLNRVAQEEVQYQVDPKNVASTNNLPMVAGPIDEFLREEKRVLEDRGSSR